MREKEIKIIWCGNSKTQLVDLFPIAVSLRHAYTYRYIRDVICTIYKQVKQKRRSFSIDVCLFCIIRWMNLLCGFRRTSLMMEVKEGNREKEKTRDIASCCFVDVDVME